MPKEDFTRNGKVYNRIIDVIAQHSIFDYNKMLSVNGTFVMAGGKTSRILQTAFLGSFLSKKENGKYIKKLGLLIHKPNKNLNFIIKLFEEGKLKPVIDKVYPLSKTAEAIKYLGAGNAKRKVVITIEH